jgi:hypothetical protein
MKRLDGPSNPFPVDGIFLKDGAAAIKEDRFDVFKLWIHKMKKGAFPRPFRKFFLEARLSKKMEHVLLVDFDARLVEGVHAIEVSRHRASALEEVEEVA